MFTTKIIQPQVAISYSKKSNITKNHYLLTVVIAALFFCSCQKEEISNNAALNSTTSSDASVNATAGYFKRKPSKKGNNGKDENNGNDGYVNYGAQITPPAEADYEDFQLKVAGQLGISCLRLRALVPCDNANPLVDHNDNKYDIVLNFNKADFQGTLMPFATNLNQYRQDLIKTLSFYKSKPVVAVIENEESNRFYYDGTAQQYIDQLQVAIDVMHDRGIKVANGGLTDQGLKYLVYQDYLNQGKIDSAEWFQNIAEVTPNAATTQDRGDFINTLLKAYTEMDLDYVNFHWKGSSPNANALPPVINYLKKRTHKPVITNEIGQFDNDPNTLLSHVQVCTDKDMPYVIWFSPDMNSGYKSTSLQYPSAVLTPSGNAYKGYLED